MSGSGGGGRRRPPRRPYYPNQRFRQYGDPNYNFSSDVSVDSQGGSFVYGAGPMEQQYRPPYRGRGRGYGPPQGFYPPQFGYGPPRGYRPPQRGRFPRHSGYNYGRGGSPRSQRPKMSGADSDEPFYHKSMFEDPWRYLLPQGTATESLEANKGGEDKAKEAVELEQSGGARGDKGEGVEGETGDEVCEVDRTGGKEGGEGEEKDTKKEVEEQKDPVAVETGSGGDEEMRNGDVGQGEGGGGGDDDGRGGGEADTEVVPVKSGVLVSEEEVGQGMAG